MALRRTSRTSPSQRDMAPESLMLELKKRWFTVRSSTVTRCAPKRPVAAPNPVMLRIMDNHLSYGATMTLSNGDDSLKCAGVEIIEGPRGGLPRSRKHGLNGLNGFYGSLGCEGSVQALIGETLGFLLTTTKTLLSFMQGRCWARCLRLPASRAIRKIRSIRSTRVPQSEEAHHAGRATLGLS